MASTYSLPFKIAVYIFLSFIALMNSVVLVNLGLDMKRGTKVHLVLLLGLSLHDALGALASLPWISLYNNPDSALCTGLVYFVRLYIIGTATFVTLLSFERFLSLVAPFWYDLHVTVKAARITSVVTSVCLLGLTGVSFSDSSVFEVKDALTNTTLTECLAMPVSSISVLMASATLTNVVLTLVFNVTVIRKLHNLRRAIHVGGAGAGGSARSVEVALLRLVLALSIVSVVTNLPFSSLAIWRLLDKESADSARMVLTVSGSLGCVGNPVMFLIFTARYRSRVRGWVRRALCLPLEQQQGGAEVQGTVAGTSSSSHSGTHTTALPNSYTKTEIARPAKPTVF